MACPGCCQEHNFLTQHETSYHCWLPSLGHGSLWEPHWLSLWSSLIVVSLHCLRGSFQFCQSWGDESVITWPRPGHTRTDWSQTQPRPGADAHWDTKWVIRIEENLTRSKPGFSHKEKSVYGLLINLLSASNVIEEMDSSASKPQVIAEYNPCLLCSRQMWTERERHGTSEPGQGRAQPGQTQLSAVTSCFSCSGPPCPGLSQLAGCQLTRNGKRGPWIKLKLSVTLSRHPGKGGR